MTGTLALQGANTVYLKNLDTARPPFQRTLFTFNSLTGSANLKNWTVSGPGLEGCATRILSDGNRVYVNVFSGRTLIQFF